MPILRTIKLQKLWHRHQRSLMIIILILPTKKNLIPQIRLHLHLHKPRIKKVAVKSKQIRLKVTEHNNLNQTLTLIVTLKVIMSKMVISKQPKIRKMVIMQMLINNRKRKKIKEKQKRNKSQKSKKKHLVNNLREIPHFRMPMDY